MSVSIGPILLQGFELPEQITFGGVQQQAVHLLPGGARVIDVLGPQPADIVWTGRMIGPDALDRAAALDQLRQGGGIVPLIIGALSYDVIVSAFEADYRRQSWIGEYRITCAVLPPMQDEAPDSGQMVQSDLDSVQALYPDLPPIGANTASIADITNLIATRTDASGNFATASRSLAMASVATAYLSRAAFLVGS